MEPLNDDELNRLLARWEAPPAPSHLERRIFGKQPWYRWLWASSIPVPVPALMLLLLLVSALVYFTPRSKPTLPTTVRELKFSDFQPVSEIKPRIVRRNHESN
jgi:hypothetical protein